MRAEDHFAPALAILRYPDRMERREIMLLDGRPPAEFDMPALDGWFDRFELDTTPGEDLVYRWAGRFAGR
ncbi:hypothetical protein LSHI6S_00110 [Leifsonia shinshuensis]